jgi:hypothetical protein
VNETPTLAGRYGSRAKSRIEMLREFIVGASQAECMDFKFSPNAGGYARISVAPFTLDYAHRVVCRWTHGDPPSDKHEAAHSCGRRSCVNPTHLRWATRTENMADAIEHGTTMRGERSPVSRLTEEQVHEARKRISSGEPVKSIAKSYGVQPTAIYSIRSGKSWAWLEDAS